MSGQGWTVDEQALQREDCRVYRDVRVVRVVDGDTVDVEIDLGFRLQIKIRVRMLGYNAPELYSHRKGTKERALGEGAKLKLEQLLGAATRVDLRTYKDRTGKYGRWLGRFMLRNEAWTVPTCAIGFLEDQGAYETFVHPGRSQEALTGDCLGAMIAGLNDPDAYDSRD